MGKRRRRGKNRSKKAQTAARFAEYAHQSYLNNVMSYEATKAQQTKYIKQVTEIENDLLSRTIFVTSAQDLRRRENLKALQQFMEFNYGPVEFCRIGKYQGKSRPRTPCPPGRVCFRQKRDAEKLFGGQPLMHGKRTKIPCAQVGYKGILWVSPTKRYADMAKEGVEHMQVNKDIVEFSISEMSLGHWVPSYDDVYETFREDLAREDQQRVPTFTHSPEEWVEEYQVDPNASLVMKINLKKRVIEIESQKFEEQLHFLSLLTGAMSTKDVLHFRFKDLRASFDCGKTTSRRLCFLFSLKLSPSLYIETTRDDIVVRDRAVEFCGLPSRYFGRCLGFKIVLEDTVFSRLSVHDKVEKLQEFGVFRRDIHSLRQQALSLAEVRTSSNQLETIRKTLESQLKAVHDGNQELGITLRAVCDGGKCSWYHLWKDKTSDGSHCPNMQLAYLLREYDRRGRADVAIQTLERILGNPGSTKFPCKLFDAQVEPPDLAEPVEETPIPKYCMRIPRVHMSPCKVKVTGMGVEMSNRVIRKFVSEHNFKNTSFLRIQVGDENGQTLFANELTLKLEAYLRANIVVGISLNGWHYQFLAYSSSQLKECSVWMVCPENGWTVERMRRSLGDFSSCKTAPKYAARIGQCFSTTVEGLLTPASNHRDGWFFQQSVTKHAVLPDVVASGGKEHSDGTGLIRRAAMDALVQGIPFGPSNPRDVGIIQIRYGGAKGTLTSWDFEEIQRRQSMFVGPQKDIILRPSMCKFDAPYTNVEVCSIGKTIPYYLNRNVILLLGVHNVPASVFLRLQHDMLEDLDLMLEQFNKAVAMLPQLSGPDSVIRSTLLHILHAGLSPADEPFLFSCLHAIRSHHLYSLRKKARILVEKGAVLMGGLDETGLVPEGCVFLQVSKRDEGSPLHDRQRSQIITGAVMCTKHPVMHPGDVRMLLAVDIPELREHRNVILFSRHGARPEADKMSGSDLDGDEFAVTWDSKFFLNHWHNCNDTERQRATVTDLGRANACPMSYDAPSAEEVEPLPNNDQERSEALVDHFFKHIRNDNLGRIAMLWQDYAAKTTAACNECIRLAELHSIAVDFPKSGVPAKIPRELLLPPDAPRAHWREIKGDRLSYHCDSVIGQLYDQVISRDDGHGKKSRKAVAGRQRDKYGHVMSVGESHNWRQMLGSVYDLKIASRLRFDDEDPATHCGLCVTRHELLKEARENCAEYEDELLALMSKYGVRSEGEVFTGCIRKFHKLHKKRQHDIAEEVRRRCREIRAEHRHVFFQTVLKVIRNAERHEKAMFADSEDDPSSLLETSLDDEDDEDGEYKDDELRMIEDAATSTNIYDHNEAWGRTVRKVAFRLSAAYYISIYSPESFRRRSKALFSFPWIVADVISAGLHEEAELRKTGLTADGPATAQHS